jgi:hypothetical protein
MAGHHTSRGEVPRLDQSVILVGEDQVSRLATARALDRDGAIALYVLINCAECHPPAGAPRERSCSSGREYRLAVNPVHLVPNGE